MATQAFAGTPSRTPTLSPLLWLCLAATWLVWGSTYLAIKFALLSFPPFLQMGTRFLFAGGVLMAWMRWRGAPWPNRREWRHALVIGTLMWAAAWAAPRWPRCRWARAWWSLSSPWCR